MNKYVLVVDDNPSDCTLAEGFLQSMGLLSISVTSAFEAIELIHDEDDMEFNLMIVDLQMPQMPGLELLKRLRNTEKTKDIPVIIMSGRKADKDVATAIKLGANDYIVKPMDSFIFEEKVLKHIGKEDSSWKEYNIPIEEPARKLIQIVECELVKLSEISAELLMSNTCEVGETIKFFSAVIGKERFSGVVEQCERVRDGEFVVRIRFTGIQEKQRKEIRKVCREIWRKHYSRMAVS